MWCDCEMFKVLLRVPGEKINLVFYLLNISNMRFVTRKPPEMLMQLTKAAPADNICTGVCGTIPPPMSNSPPTAVVPEIAFVTDMSGECRAGVTPQTVW
jgi:hypothetical protein